MARSFAASSTDTIYWQIPGVPGTVGCVSFWMRSTQVTANAAVLTYWSNASRNGFGFLLNNSANKISVASFGTTATNQTAGAVSTTSVNDGNPHHVAYVYNRAAGGAYELYIDGVLEASGTSAASWITGLTGYVMQMGDNLDAFWPTFAGSIWEACHWFTIIPTADEIAAMAKGFSGHRIKTNSLISYAPLVRDVKELRNGYAATVTGGSASDHGRVIGSLV